MADYLICPHCGKKIQDYAFAKALGTTTSYLFSEDEPEEPQTIAAHFDGDEYTQEELDKIKEFAEFVKSSRK